MPNIFLSHNSQDKRFVERLASDLKKKGVDVWYDKWEIRVGDSITARINEAISRMDYLAVVLTPASVASRWVQMELNAALMRELAQNKVCLLPILAEPCQIPPLIADRLYADFRKDYYEGFFALLQTVLPSEGKAASKARTLAAQDSSTRASGTIEFIETSLPGVLVLKPRVFGDPRGFFMETYRQSVLAGAGIKDQFVQDNHSRSSRGVLRGLHYQLRNPQAKLCRVVQGEVLDIAVDIRVGSPNFGRWVSVLLSAENHLQLYIPKGFAHGFVVRSETADFLYKCSDYYDAGDDRGVLWNDPAIGIDWQTPSPLLSEKDRRYLSLSQIARDQLPRYQL